MLCFGLSLFLFAFFFHLVLWRFYIPKRQTRTLLVLFVMVWILGLAFRYYLADSEIVPSFSFVDSLHVSLLYASLYASYAVTYIALEVDSPSLVIALRIAKAGSRGLPREELHRLTDNDLLVVPRVRDLVRDRWIFFEKERYRLTRKGRFFAELFILFRGILRAGKGG